MDSMYSTKTISIHEAVSHILIFCEQYWYIRLERASLLTEKIRFGSSHHLSARQTIHMKCQTLFPLGKKMYFVCYILHDALKVKHCRCVFQHKAFK